MLRPSYGKNDGIFSDAVFLNLDIHVLFLSFLFHARVLRTLFAPAKCGPLTRNLDFVAQARHQDKIST